MLIEDTRQQRGKHGNKAAYFESVGEGVVRCALPVGDYQRPAKVAVDTKKDIIELGVDLKSDHERFRRECERAKELGTQLVILVENEDGVRSLADLQEWVETDESYSRRNRSGKAIRYTGKSIAKACMTMHRAYGVMFGFCPPSESGERVLAILDKLGG
jgi:hypothetical protein